MNVTSVEIDTHNQDSLQLTEEVIILEVEECSLVCLWFMVKSVIEGAVPK